MLFLETNGNVIKTLYPNFSFCPTCQAAENVKLFHTTVKYCTVLVENVFQPAY